MPIKIKAFTLSEILITLAIIGVVAALTIPNLVYSYKKRVVETRLLKFYNIMNETIRLSEIDNGDKTTWSFPTNQFADNKEKFYNKYFKNYLKSERRSKEGYNYHVYFTDGTGMSIIYGTTDYIYCIDAKYLKQSTEYLGSKCFQFGFYPGANQSEFTRKNYLNKGLEPYVSNKLYASDVTDSTNSPTCVKDENDECVIMEEKDLYTNKLYATKIIQMNNWKIPDDYPWKL